MRAALTLARRGLGQVSPNPAVAALVVRDDTLLARGVTARDGRPHAEVVALSRLPDRAAARGADVYVTLEPCAHHGRTPPCADALIAAGVHRVVCPLRDPDPRVDGRGFAALEAAGVHVVTGVLAAEAAALNRGFFTRLAAGRPHVVLKLATTLDGHIATARGESRWITGPMARRRVHAMRREVDAVMVGIGTALADDPMLDARGVGRARRPVTRVVVDPKLRLPVTSRLVQTARQAPVMILHADGAAPATSEGLAAAGVRLVATPAGPHAPLHGHATPEGGGLDLAAGLNALAREGVSSVLCEGGGRLAAALLKAGLVDEVVVFAAGRVFGAGGTAAVGTLPDAPISTLPGFTLAAMERLGDDVMSIWHPRATRPATGE